MWTDILFDLDGTLTDSGEGITNSVRYALQEMNHPVPPQKVLNRFVGPPLNEMFAAACGLSGDAITEAITHFRIFYERTGFFQNEVYPGIPALLEKLKAAGKTLYVATTKPLPLAENVLRRFELAHHFSLLAGSTMEHAGRQKADVVAEVLQRAHIRPATAVMVGDRLYDVQGAHACGLPCVGVLFGYGDEEELTTAGADCLATDVQALGDILLA